MPRRVHVPYIATVSVIATAYWATGRLALLLAIPPGYATAIWPPAGIALAAFLVYGARMWPGIVLGSFLVNVATAFDPTNVLSILQSLALPASIGVGAALQARVGACLVRHVVGFSTALDREHDVTWFLLLGGPVSCLVGATWGVTSLLASGIVPWANALFTWWTWWVGDTIGALVVTPLILVWAAEPRQVWRRRWLSVALPLCLAFGLVVVFFWYARTAEQGRITREFERQASTLANTLEESLNGYLEVLQAIESFYTSTREMGRQQFRTFVQRSFARHPGLQALSWDRLVPDAERTAYEAAVRQEGSAAFEITEQNAQGQLVRAAQRPEYVTVSYIEPPEGNESALGYDTASSADRLEALQRARDTGKPRATGRTILVQETGQQSGLLLFLPIYGHGLPHDTVEERRRNLHGYATAVFRIGDMVEASLRAFAREDVVLRIYDETASGGARLLYSHQQRAPGGMQRPFDEADWENPARLHWSTTLAVAGRQWTLRFSPTLKYLTAQRSWYAWTVLASGLLFVGLLGGFLLVLTGRAIRMEHLVAERTAANATLEREIAERTRAEAALAAEARFLRAQTAVAAVALSSLDADTLARQLLAAVCRAQEYAYGLLWRTVDDGRTAVVVASYGDETAPFLGYRVRLDEPTAFIARVIHRRQPLFCNRVPESPYATRPMIEALGGQALLGVPLVSRTGHVLGALAFGDAHNLERFVARDLQQGPILAHQVAQAIENSALFQQLQQLEEHYRVVTKTLHDAVYMVNRDGQIVFANAALERLTGYRIAELLDQPSLILYPPEVIPELLQRRSAVFSGNDVPAYMQTPLQHKQGQRILVELSRAALYQDAQMTGYVVVARDLSERLHLEAQLRQVQKLQAIGTLAGGIAHDFNNILSAILGYTELALDDVPPTTLARCNLEQVLIAGYRAKDLVQQILTFSRQGEPGGKPVQLARLVTEALTLLRAALPSTIAIRRELHEETGTVLADPTQLHQVLLNLCTNAAHAMRDAGGVLTVCLDACDVTAPAAVHPQLTPGAYLRLMVRDTGHGMPPTILERIFEPFFTTKGVGEGTGMGLAVVHGIVTKWGGAIAVESAPGHGTTFTVYLPRSDRPAAALTALEDAVLRGTERILFVDDEDALAQLGDQLLTRLGYDVVTWTSSVEAWDAFRAQPDRFDLVITDQTMPSMTGDVLARALRQMRPDLPIILCTGFSQRITVEQAKDIGIDAVCLKPLVARDLARTIRQVLAQRTAQET